MLNQTASKLLTRNMVNLNRLWTSLFLTMIIVFLVAAEDKSMSIDGTTVDIVGRSGKMKLYAAGGTQTDDSKLFVEFSSLIEVDAQNAAVGKGGSSKHSFNNFAQLDFSFGDLTTDTDVPYATGDGVKANSIPFEASLGSGSTLKVVTYLIQGSGELDVDGETISVSPKQLKFNIELDSWSFCVAGDTTCKDGEVGEYIDLTITLKPVGGGDVKKEGDSFDLGGGATMQVSKKIQLDGTWTDMPSGYPKYEVQGAKHNFIFRFPKFSDKIVYDPLLTAPGSESNGATSVLPESLISLLVFINIAAQQYYA